MPEIIEHEISGDQEQETSERLLSLAKMTFEQRQKVLQGTSADVWFGKFPDEDKEVSFKINRSKGDEKNSLATQYSLLEKFYQAGVRVPRPLAYLTGSKVEEFGPEGLLVTEKIPGRTLEDEIRFRIDNHQPFSRDEMMAIIRDASEQIKRAHEMRLYHRDLHLNNVMLMPDGKIVFIDFGKAKKALGGEDEQTIYRHKNVREDVRLMSDDSFVSEFSKAVKKNNLLES